LALGRKVDLLVGLKLVGDAVAVAVTTDGAGVTGVTVVGSSVGVTGVEDTEVVTSGSEEVFTMTWLMMTCWYSPQHLLLRLCSRL
jgi:hypothetical protein